MTCIIKSFRSRTVLSFCQQTAQLFIYYSVIKWRTWCTDTVRTPNIT